MSLKTRINRHPLFVYFLLAYAISWGGILFIASLKGLDPRAIKLTDGALMYLFMLLGPSLSSLTLTALLEGKDGVKHLFKRMTNWKVGWNWYLPLLTIPILSTAVFLIFSTMVSPIYKPNMNLAFGLVIGGLAGLFEETGWTGFALPRLQSKYGVFLSGLILGLLWACWHGMADYWGNIANFGANWLPHFILYWIIPLTAYRILMAWVYKNTNSLLLGQLMHVFYTGTLVTVEPTMAVTESILWIAPFAAALWVVVIIVMKRR